MSKGSEIGDMRMLIWNLLLNNVIKGGYSYSGQRCTSVKVICVMESVAEELVTKIVEKR
jgi:glyceraldehyde-3-phosphate dehydrogenase (NADP+)